MDDLESELHKLSKELESEKVGLGDTINNMIMSRSCALDI